MPEIVQKQSKRSWANSLGKRTFDLAVAFAALSISLPVFVIVAVCIKFTSRGPVFFKQLRTGRGEVPFTIYKFRTMRNRQAEGPSVTRKNDYRITALGRLLRVSKLDELPQFYNVLKGDMSLVGPRPKLVGHEYGPLRLKPGITGAATLVFSREEDLLAEVPDEHIDDFTITVLHRLKAELDNQYARDCSFLSDIKILFNTLPLAESKAITSLDELKRLYSIPIEDYFERVASPRPSSNRRAGRASVAASAVASSAVAVSTMAPPSN